MSKRVSRLPSPRSLPLALAAFGLGACASVAVQSAASDPSPSAASEAPTPAAAPTVLALEDAPEQLAPNDSARIRHLARGQAAYLGRLDMQAGAAVPLHRDPTEEFIHVLEGSGTISIDGQAYPVSAGSTIYMPANAEVSFQNGEAPMAALQVFAGPDPAAKYEAWKPAPAPE